MPEHPPGMEQRVAELEQLVAAQGRLIEALQEWLGVVDRSLPGCNVRYVKERAKLVVLDGLEGD